MGILNKLKESVYEGMTLSLAVDAFAAVSEEQAKSDFAWSGNKRFEAGIFNHNGKPQFCFSLSQQLPPGDADKGRVRLDVRFPPDTVNAQFGQASSETGVSGDFFDFVRKSDAYKALCNAKIKDFSVSTESN